MLFDTRRSGKRSTHSTGKFMKLVRDNIPQIVENSGRRAHTRVAKSKDEFSALLNQKLQEEGNEFLEAPSVEEAADIYEVLRAMCDLNEISLDDVVVEADRKRSEKGGFTNRVILEKITDKTIQLGTMVTPKFSTSYLLSKENRPEQGDIGIVVSVRKFIDYDWHQYEVSFSGDKIDWYFESELDILEQENLEDNHE